MQTALHDDPAFGESDFLADLQVEIPACLLDGWGDVFGTDVPLAEGFFVYSIHSVHDFFLGTELYFFGLWGVKRLV